MLRPNFLFLIVQNLKVIIVVGMKPGLMNCQSLRHIHWKICVPRTSSMGVAITSIACTCSWNSAIFHFILEPHHYRQEDRHTSQRWIYLVGGLGCLQTKNKIYVHFLVLTTRRLLCSVPISHILSPVAEEDTFALGGGHQPRLKFAIVRLVPFECVGGTFTWCLPPTSGTYACHNNFKNGVVAT